MSGAVWPGLVDEVAVGADHVRPRRRPPHAGCSRRSRWNPGPRRGRAHSAVDGPPGVSVIDDGDVVVEQVGGSRKSRSLMPLSPSWRSGSRRPRKCAGPEAAGFDFERVERPSPSLLLDLPIE